jgi:hypothetical protein
MQLYNMLRNAWRKRRKARKPPRKKRRKGKGRK